MAKKYKIKFMFQSSYSVELNPTEFINNYLKDAQRSRDPKLKKMNTAEKGLRILLDFHPRYYKGAYLKVYRYMHKQLQKCISCIY